MTRDPLSQFGRVLEAQLKEYASVGVVSHAQIVGTVEGYTLVVRLDWLAEYCVLYTQRGKPRRWASLDTLVAYLREVAPAIKMYDLQP